MRPAHAGDPRGNGRQLLGIGIPVPSSPFPVFMEVESIDTTSITDEAGHSITSVVVRNHELTGSISSGGSTRSITGTGWVGARLQGKIRCRNNDQNTFPVTLHVTGMLPSDKANLGGKPPPAWQFALELDSPTGRAPRKAACEWPLGAPNGPRNAALPVQGHWDPRGNYVADETISFACVEDVVVKCLQRGYPIHDDSAGPHRYDTDKESLFKACTRALRADYCGNGTSFTQDGASVDLRDTANIAQDPLREALTFEAAWSSEGMFCLGHLRYKIPDEDYWQHAASCALYPDRRCSTMEQAQALLEGRSRPLLFVDSCPQHPCAADVPGAAQRLK